jgi:glycosyltransferase involved in cell wall biosynthesis
MSKNQGEISKAENLSKAPLVSIITAVYNGEKYLTETIESILNQSYSNLECIIIDGKSTDNTVEIIKKYESRLAFWKSETDRGLYEAWNKALAVAKGEWICFVGSDDILLPNAIQDYIQLLNQSKESNIKFISSKVELVRNDLSTIRIIGTAWKWSKFRIFMNATHVGSLHHMSLFEKYGLFDVTYKICGDYEFLLRVGSKLKTQFLNQITVKMRNEDGLSVSSIKPHLETYKAKVKNGARDPLMAKWDLVFAILKMSIRKMIR